MKTNRKRIVGIFLIILGALFLFNNLNLLPPIPDFVFSWPMILIAVGFFNLLTGNSRPAYILFIIGGFFLVQRYLDVDLHVYWPLILVLIGLSFLIRSKSSSISTTSTGFFDDLNILGGSKKRFTSDPLHGGRITNIFGGSEIDLSECKPVNGAVIEILVVFGGCDIIVPDEWQLTVDTTAIFGGFTDKRSTKQVANSIPVTIKGTMIFGGGDLKSK